MSITLQQRIDQLRQRQSALPELLRSVSKTATAAAVAAATDATPPTNTPGDLAGTHTRTGALKQHWATDSTLDPVRNGNTLVTKLANDMQYASYVDQGHRQDMHYVPGLYINEMSGLLEYDPGRKDEVGIVVGTKTKYVPGLYMADKGVQAYRDTAQRLLPGVSKEVFG